uniref:Uncharacterized protein n=1 Tax=viral metagenome TaxID=1070528 RepID=A0A6C0E6V2_9ZZZZ
MEDAKIAILTDAKQEYSHHLASVLKTPMYKGLKSLYQEADRISKKEKRDNEVLSEFQNLLSQVRLWSQDMINNEFKRISDDSQCDFIKELVTAVFMSHTQILQFVRQGEKAQTKLNIPKPEHFIHKCYINCAREFWKDPIWFYENSSMSANELKKNIRESENIIYTCINDTIRELLPFRRILKTYLKDAYNEEELDKNNIEEPMSGGLSKTYQNNLREIIKSEIASYTADKENSESEIKSLIAQELKLNNDDVEVAETSPKTLTNKVNAQLKNPNDDFIESVPEISLEEMTQLSENSDTDDEEEMKPQINLDIDLEEVKTPKQGDNISFDFNEVDLNLNKADTDLENTDNDSDNDSLHESLDGFDELDLDLKPVSFKQHLDEPLKKPEPIREQVSFRQPTREPLREPLRELVPTREPVKEPTREPLREPLREPVPTREPVKEPLREPAPARELVKEPEPVRELVRESVKESELMREFVKAPSVDGVKQVEFDLGNQKKKNDKNETILVEKENNNKQFDPNFDLDGEVNLWDDTPLQPKQETKLIQNTPKPINDPKPINNTETYTNNDVGPKKFKFFSRN